MRVPVLFCRGIGSAHWAAGGAVCRSGRAMVTSKRFFSEVSVRTENSATNTAQQYIVTLPHVFAMDARQILQQWKQIADNMSTQLNLAADKPEPSVVAHADTRNMDILMPSWARPVAEVALPPPGAAVAVEIPEEEPTLPPPRGSHLQAAQSSPDPHVRRNGGVAQRQRRREQAQDYVPPE